MIRVLITEVDGILACWTALNTSGNVPFFKRYRLVAVLMTVCEPHLSNGWAALQMIPVIIEYTQALIHKCILTHSKEMLASREGRAWREREGYKGLGTLK